MGQIKKITHAIMYTNWGSIQYNKVPSFFFIWPILEASAEILQKNLVTFWAMEFQEK